MSRRRIFPHNWFGVGLFFVLSLACLTIGSVFVFEYLRMMSCHRFPLVTGHVVERSDTRVLIASRPLVRIRVDGSDDFVYALLSADGYVPDTVTFHYSGTPGTEVYVQEESNPLWIALLLLTAGPFFGLIGYHAVGGPSKPEQSGDADSTGTIRIDVGRQMGWIVLPFVVYSACWCPIFLGAGLDQIPKNMFAAVGMFALAALCGAGAVATCWLVPYRKTIVVVSPDGLTITNKGLAKYYSWGQNRQIQVSSHSRVGDS